jgi:hypothetical protein
MFNVVKHARPMVSSKLRLALVAGLLSILALVGGAQKFGINPQALAASTVNSALREVNHVFAHESATAKLIPVRSSRNASQDQQQIRLVSTSAAPGSQVTVPVEFNAEGSEHSIAFSLRFDATALGKPQVTLTEETRGATLIVNADEIKAGRLGVQLVLAEGQQLGAGVRTLVNLEFNVSPRLNVATLPLEFDDQPVARLVADAKANVISTGFINGLVAVQPGLEADVAPRENSGNAVLSVADWALLGRFAAQLDTASNGIEFQRADCAPRASLGDGQITLADWVQAGRYAAALDAPVAAGGPSAPVALSGAGALNALIASPEQARVVRIVPATFQRGQNGSTQVELTALGTEFAVGFTLNFDPTQLNFVSAVAGADAIGATVVVNANDAANGRVIINLSLPFGQKFSAGTKQILTLTFNVPGTSTLNSTTVGFSNGAVVDEQAATLPASFNAGVITLTPTVTGQPPVLTSLNPANVLVGGTNFVLTVNGSDFTNGSTVRVNGSDRFTEYVNATQLRASLIATDLLETGTLSITVRTPEALTSNALTLSVNNPVPTLTSLNPASVATNTPGVTLTVNGTNFVPGAQIKFNNVDRITFYVSSTQLTTQLPASALNTAGTFNVLVTNPAPGGGASNVLTFSVNAPKPIPRVSSINPTTTQAGGAAFTLTVNGSGFVSESVVRWNGEARPTTFVSPTQLTAQITAADIANAGPASVTVYNSPPGGGVSSAQIFTITQPPNPVPTVTALNPATVAAGGQAFTLTVTGTNFVQTSVVRLNGQDRPTTYVSATELRAALTAADIANGGTAQVQVFNPTPGGGLSAEVPLTITFAAPTITLISPSSAVAGGPAFTLSVTGTNFAAGSVLRWNGENRPTTVVNVTELTAQIPAADIANVGTAKITVFSPTANATSNEITFTINQATRPLPRITALSPDGATAGGGAFTLTVTGVNFVSDSVVRWNGQVRPTTFVNSTQLTAQITAADIANLGTASVTVFTPPAGGGESNPLTFNITQAPNPVPVITSLNPPNATAGANGVTLTINGSGFVAASFVRLNGNGETRPTTLVNANQLTVQLTANDITSAGTLTLAVVNPAPGGGTSNSVTLNIINAVPVLTSLTPNVVAEDAMGVTLAANGTGFIRGSQIVINGNARQTTYISATQLTTVLTANDLTAVGTLQVQVSNPAPGGGLSNALPLEVRKRSPLPRIATLNPTSALAGGGGFTLIVTGTGFVPGSVVRWNGHDRPTDFGSETLLVAQIPATDIAAGGTAQVAVFNPAPGGGTSGSVAFSITNPAPRITSINPDTAVAGSGAVALIINGSGFTANSQVRFNGNDVPTTYVTNSQLNAQVPAAATAAGGTFVVSVFNPAPGGGLSGAVNFIVTNPVPVLAQLVPNTAAAGSPGFVLTLIGTGFTPASVVRWNGQDRLTTYIGQTQLTAVVNAADVAQIGTAQVTVFTPAPGGGTSAALAFTVKDEPNPVPTLASLNPNQAFSGGPAFTLTITGTGFVAGSRVQWNGETRPTMYISTTQIVAQITAADIANAATANVTVVNPAPGGGPSNVLPFSIVPPPNPVPVINNITPNASFTGATPITLTVNGTGFVNESVVRWNGTDRPTTRVSATQLTAQIPATDLAQAGTAAVTVFTPPSVSGGGGTSNTASFAIRQLPAAQIALTPNAPTTNDTITAQLSGTWPDGCIPQNPQVSIVGNEVRISTSNPNQACPAVVTPWNLSTTFGPLPAAGNYLVRVFYTAPLGTAEIGQATFAVINGRPTLVSLAPSQALVGSAGQLLTVNGTGFFSGAVVQVNGAARETTFVSPTQLTAQLTNTDLLSGGVLSITAVNPAPGGGISNALPFVVNNPQPLLSAINPAAVQAGSGAFTLTVTGTGFIPGAVVRWNGADRLTTFISNTTLTAAIAAADIANTGAANITVFNPGPGGGPSTAVSLTIDNAPQCQAICFQSPVYYVLNMSRLPNGSVLIAGVNFNQPVSIQENLADVKRALQGGRSTLAQLNAEYVAAQISLLAVSGPFPTAGVLNGVLRCYGVNFAAVTLTNGFTVTVNTTIGDLLNQARLALTESRTEDMGQLAIILDLINGNDPNNRCTGFNAGAFN